ncbi:MAG: hypothetical protein JNM18_14790 [Planctomycetaceae bacterium]|nr:hypothetical protein [Planctomycetaceae bacterium]
MKELFDDIVDRHRQQLQTSVEAYSAAEAAALQEVAQAIETWSSSTYRTIDPAAWRAEWQALCDDFRERGITIAAPTMADLEQLFAA